ncbi:MAG: 4-amino-4-deoxychorismate lyase [Arcobacteraceae bacterium]|jgi:4-amino-4-deoxychorismate lyase
MNYFETIKCNDCEIFNLSYHEKRIANTIGKNINLQNYVYPINSKLLKCKVVYNEDEVINVSFQPYSKKIITTFKLVYDDTINYQYKSENRENLEHLYLQRESADEIIIVKNNLITDTTIANIAIFLDGQWFTPKVPLLKGTARQRYIDNLKIKEMDISGDMLMKAQKIALLNAMIDFDTIDDYKILA